MTTAEWAESVGRWFPEIAYTLLRQSTWPQIERHREPPTCMSGTGRTGR